MKKYNGLLIGSVAVYLLLAFFLFRVPSWVQDNRMFAYKAEVNRIYQEIVHGTRPEQIDLQNYEYVQKVRYLSKEELLDEESQKDFFADRNQFHTVTKPLYVHEEQKGYLCFDYLVPENMHDMVVIMEWILLAVFLVGMGILLFIRQAVLKPFTKLQNMPYEMAKGHLRGELPESGRRYFGKFVWGLSMLRESLNHARQKELSLMKEKKMLLLQISHDLKIPLSTIRLYARSIYEDVADTEEKKKECAEKIEQHCVEIQNFVQKIMHAVSEEVMAIEVTDGQFYLQDYVNRISSLYQEKCKNCMTDFEIAAYRNLLLKGDLERAVEVMENLMENALKYGDGRKITISFYEEDGHLILEVFNTGETVQKQEIPHLFDSFFRGSNTEGKEGNGLGLYICRQIMMKMNGDIYLKNADGGMCFCLAFPLL